MVLRKSWPCRVCRSELPQCELCRKSVSRTVGRLKGWRPQSSRREEPIFANNYVSRKRTSSLERKTALWDPEQRTWPSHAWTADPWTLWDHKQVLLQATKLVTIGYAAIRINKITIVIILTKGLCVLSLWQSGVSWRHGHMDSLLSFPAAKH